MCCLVDWTVKIFSACSLGAARGLWHSHRYSEWRHYFRPVTGHPIRANRSGGRWSCWRRRREAESFSLSFNCIPAFLSGKLFECSFELPNFSCARYADWLSGLILAFPSRYDFCFWWCPFLCCPSWFWVQLRSVLMHLHALLSFVTIPYRGIWFQLSLEAKVCHLWLLGLFWLIALLQVD